MNVKEFLEFNEKIILKNDKNFKNIFLSEN